ncbi:MAG TPA: hypothetical protein VGP93_03540, partial [Polyangiaceae bacterium]|nr:hypothetical protein [Polyangiaceae bacterium]
RRRVTSTSGSSGTGQAALHVCPQLSRKNGLERQKPAERDGTRRNATERDGKPRITGSEQINAD